MIVDFNVMASLVKHGRIVEVRLDASCHSSVFAAQVYRVVHVAEEHNVIWVINPDTNRVLTITNAASSVKRVYSPAGQVAPHVAKEERYILWNPKSPRPPKVVHTSLSVAKEVSASMAEEHKGETFYVCRLVGRAYFPKPVKVEAQYEEL